MSGYQDDFWVSGFNSQGDVRGISKMGSRRCWRMGIPFLCYGAKPIVPFDLFHFIEQEITHMELSGRYLGMGFRGGLREMKF